MKMINVYISTCEGDFDFAMGKINFVFSRRNSHQASVLYTAAVDHVYCK